MKNELSNTTKKIINKLPPDKRAAAIESLTYVPIEHRAPEKREPGEHTVPGVYVNEHRNTCILLSVNDGVAMFVAMRAEGLDVEDCDVADFDADWQLTAADYDPAGAAAQYLASNAAKSSITKEAKTRLTALVKCGDKPTTTKENSMIAAPAPTTLKAVEIPPPMAKGKAAAKPAAPAPAPAAKGKTAAAKPVTKPTTTTKEKTMTTTKATTKAATKVTKPAAKAAKPAAKATPTKAPAKAPTKAPAKPAAKVVAKPSGKPVKAAKPAAKAAPAKSKGKAGWPFEDDGKTKGAAAPAKGAATAKKAAPAKSAAVAQKQNSVQPKLEELRKLVKGGVTSVQDLADKLLICKKSVRKLMSQI